MAVWPAARRAVSPYSGAAVRVFNDDRELDVLNEYHEEEFIGESSMQGWSFISAHRQRFHIKVDDFDCGERIGYR